MNFKLRMLALVNIIMLTIAQGLLKLGCVKIVDVIIHQAEINTKYIGGCINNEERRNN